MLRGTRGLTVSFLVGRSREVQGSNRTGNNTNCCEEEVTIVDKLTRNMIRETRLSCGHSG